MDRRLAAILAADVAGFSALLGRDEEGAVRALKGHLAALEPMIGLNGGRLVKSTGDGFLAEFGSVVAAVSCAVSMQRQLAERNAVQPERLQMAFRMGVHTGDVVIDGDDILGDGVNIAARLRPWRSRAASSSPAGCTTTSPTRWTSPSAISAISG